MVNIDIANGSLPANLNSIQNLDPNYISKKLKELSTLAEINKEIHSTVRIDRLLQILVEKTIIGVNFERGLIYLVKGNFLQCVAFLDRSKREEASLVKKLVGFRMDETSAEVLAVKMGKPIYIENAYSDPRMSKKFLKIIDTHEYCIVPLLGRHRTLGVFTGDKFYSRQPIVPEDIKTLQLFAEHISLAIENAQLYEEKENFNQILEKKVIARTSELSQMNQELSTLYEMSQLLSKSLQVNTVSSQILDLIQRLGYPACCLHMFHEQVHGIERFLGLEHDELQAVEPLVVDLARKKEDMTPFIVSGPVPDDWPAPLLLLLRKRSFGSVLLFPIKSKGTLLAVLTIFGKEPIPDTEKLKHFFTAFTRQAGVALENALLFQEMMDQKNHMESMSRRLEKENISLKQRINSDPEDEFVVGSSPRILEVMDLIQKVASTDAIVTLYGETGTGKEVMAKQIHKQSARSEGPLINVNCTAIPEELMESELFGHEKGAFTGAHQKRVGLFELAKGGSIFLDEIGDLSLKTQTKLLRVLQEQEIQPLGAKGPKRVDARIIVATNRDLPELVKSKRFRSDLYYRLNVFPITIPPLRERKGDIGELARFFLRKYARSRKHHSALSKEVMNILLSYSWPGNVRELENVLERVLIMAVDRPVEVKDLPKELLDSPVPNLTIRPLREAIQVFKKDMVIQALDMAGGKKSAAAELLNLPRSNFSRLIKNLNIID